MCMIELINENKQIVNMKERLNFYGIPNLILEYILNKEYIPNMFFIRLCTIYSGILHLQDIHLLSNRDDYTLEEQMYNRTYIYQKSEKCRCNKDYCVKCITQNIIGSIILFGIIYLIINQL